MPAADQLLGILWRRKLIALLTFVLVLGAVAAVTYSLPKTYSTSAYLVVNTTKPTTSDFEAQQVSQVDTQTAAELLGTRNTANLVAARLPYADTGKHVQGQVDISPVSSTQLVLITARESSPTRAQELADTYARVFTGSRASAIGFARVSLGEPAPLIQDPSAPRPTLYLLIGAVLAALAALGSAVARERLDRSLQVDPFASELLGLPILARVPEIPRRRGARARAGSHHDIRFIEGFRGVFANLSFVTGERPNTIAVVSAAEGEGKSTVCLAMANAAEEIVSAGVLLVDADLRRPVLARRLELTDGGEGLSSFLVDQDFGTRGIRQLVSEIPESTIGVVPAGPVPPSSVSLLGLPSLESFVEEARNLYEFVIFDTPPLSVGVDASLVASRLDGAILVVDSQKSQQPSVEWSLRQLRRARVRVLGVVVNRVSQPSPDTYYYGRSGRDRGRPSRRSRRDATAGAAPKVTLAARSPASPSPDAGRE